MSDVEVSVFRRGGRLAGWDERGWLVPEAAAIHTSLVLIGGPDENDATAALMRLFRVSLSDIADTTITPLRGSHGTQGSVVCLRSDRGAAAVLVIMGDTAAGVSLAARWLAMEGFRQEKSTSFVHRVYSNQVGVGEPMLNHRRALAVCEWA